MKKAIVISAVIIFTGIIVYAYRMPILFKIGGLEQPRVETTGSIKDFLAGNSARYHVLAVAKDSVSFRMLSKNIGIPGVIFFNKNRQPIKCSEGIGCPKVARRFASELNSNAIFNIDTSGLTVSQLSEVLDACNVLEGEELLAEDVIKKYDYIVVYGWCKYLPGQSATMAGVGKELLGNKDVSVLVISVNLDFVNTWYKSAEAPKLTI